MTSGPTAENVKNADRYRDKELLESVFQDWDMNRDGTLSKGELRAVMKKVGMGDSDIGKLFQTIDANNDGKIAYKEFVDWLFADSGEAEVMKQTIYRTNSKKEAMKEFFEYVQELMDIFRDRDGKETSSSDGKQWGLADIFKQMDANGNGQINMTEFVAGVQGMGHKIDEGMIQTLFKDIDNEIKNRTAAKKPKKKAESMADAEWQRAFGKDWEKAKAKHLGEDDLYAENATPNLSSAEPVYYCGNDKKLLAKKALVHASNVEYEEVLTGGIDKHTGKPKTVRRKVAAGGSRDYQINMDEFTKAFKEAMGEK